MEIIQGNGSKTQLETSRRTWQGNRRWEQERRSRELFCRESELHFLEKLHAHRANSLKGQVSQMGVFRSYCWDNILQDVRMRGRQQALQTTHVVKLCRTSTRLAPSLSWPCVSAWRSDPALDKSLPCKSEYNELHRQNSTNRLQRPGGGVSLAYYGFSKDRWDGSGQSISGKMSAFEKLKMYVGYLEI